MNTWAEKSRTSDRGAATLADARRSIAHCYQITGVPLGISVGEQTWWARSSHAMRRAHLETCFYLPRGS